MAYKTLYTINIGSFSMSLIRSHERFIACWNTSQKVTAWRVEITYKEVRLQHVVAKCTVCKKIPKELNTARHRQQVNPRKEWTHAWNHVHLPRLRTHAILGWNAAPGSRLWPEQGERFPASLWGRDLSGGGTSADGPPHLKYCWWAHQVGMTQGLCNIVAPSWCKQYLNADECPKQVSYIH